MHRTFDIIKIRENPYLKCRKNLIRQCAKETLKSILVGMIDNCDVQQDNRFEWRESTSIQLSCVHVEHF